MKISFDLLHTFLEVFQEFQNISGQDLVNAINDCYDGYFQELLVAIGKLYDEFCVMNKRPHLS